MPRLLLLFATVAVEPNKLDAVGLKGVLAVVLMEGMLAALVPNMEFELVVALFPNKDGSGLPNKLPPPEVEVVFVCCTLGTRKAAI